MNNRLLKADYIDIYAFQQDLLTWFNEEQRDLPWRKDKDPYKIWVSEIMLQQTRVDTVIPYFHRFIEQFPTIAALSEAEEEKVLKAWEGLGYYSRARNLQTAVREVYEKYGGVVPNHPKEIATLKGVGPYTAGAILSIAYGLPEPAVDGNVMRVLSRILLITDDIAKASSRKVFEAAVRELISHDNPSDFNQALMELGALICTPRSPSCLLCPVRDHCHAFNEGKQNELPVKVKKIKKREVQLAAALLTDSEGRLLIRKRPDKGLLANLWEFPNIELNLQYVSEKEQLKEAINTKYDTNISITDMIGQIEHIFTHLTWNINVYQGKLDRVIEDKDLKLVSLEEIKIYPFPVSHQKMLKQYIEAAGI
ncbi:A/G-specific adenine glycosylase [Cytobacillus purgationiresistens]|uniref:Adenine DNA glycosylase n=1 Tax=Cytobacillus purgationiresistens TaxID=863449 RepID=A0ABU0AQN7_9BACI|nr:A/G-specific adenine glycosylase [Cytobacillus purgationiresistens]MDQ0273611.1 A/G-specific adenine glycosylase [Cytobacillus purgationiresistens]